MISKSLATNSSLINNINNINIYATKGSMTVTMTDNNPEKKEKDTIEIEKEWYLSSLIQGSVLEEENKASRLGLFKVYAYCCMRCNHIWLPRISSGYNPFTYNKIVLNSEPPKSCAKCKSKSWLKIP